MINTDCSALYGAYGDGPPGYNYRRLAYFNARDPDAQLGVDRFGGNPTLPNTTDWYGRFRTRAGPQNDFFLDREIQWCNESHAGYSGIPGGAAVQDAAITWSMGSIYQRQNKRLGTTDVRIIRVRRRLIEAARALAEQGTIPPGVDNPDVYRVRSGGVFLPRDANWVAATEALRKAFVHHAELDPALTGDG